MNKKNIILILFWSLTAMVSIRAQQSVGGASPKASPTPPAPPLLHQVPDLMQWVITYTVEGSVPSTPGYSDKEKAKKADPIVTKTVLKGGGVIVEVAAKTGAAPIQTWCMPGGVQIHSADGKNWIVGAPTAAGFETADYRAQDFAGLSWISTQNFKGEVDYQGRKCFVFSDKVVTTESSELKAIKLHLARSFDTVKEDDNGNITVKEGVMPEFNVEDYKKEVFAYIDQETRLPVAVFYKTPTGIVTRSYQYQKLQSMPPVPPEVKKALDAFKQRAKSLSVPNAPI
jgi:hypothetical protein